MMDAILYIAIGLALGTIGAAIGMYAYDLDDTDAATFIVIFSVGWPFTLALIIIYLGLIIIYRLGRVITSIIRRAIP